MTPTLRIAPGSQRTPGTVCQAGTRTSLSLAGTSQQARRRSHPRNFDLAPRTLLRLPLRVYPSPPPGDSARPGFPALARGFPLRLFREDRPGSAAVPGFKPWLPPASRLGG
jgi:hypothetical protein